jgi:formylglycine-generating enzyme required for sulfatase activity
MSKYEITNAQYAYFLNMVAAKEDPHHLFKDEMQSSARGGITRWVQTNGRFCYVAKSFMTDKPVNHITFYDVARFTNWLENWERTQNPIGATTEKGTYNMADPLLYINNQSRNPKAIWALPNGNEWLKAAYYDHGVYHFFAAGLGDEPFFGGATPTGQMSPSGFNFANYAAAANWPSGMTGGNVVSVGSAGGMSAYGVSDMNGNVYELTEQVVCLANLCGRDVRGGSYASNHSGFSNGIPLVSGLLIFYAYIWDGLDPSNNPGPIAYTDTMGFRVVKLH